LKIFGLLCPAITSIAIMSVIESCPMLKSIRLMDCSGITDVVHTTIREPYPTIRLTVS
jgi:hypothetical protein